MYGIKNWLFRIFFMTILGLGLRIQQTGLFFIKGDFFVTRPHERRQTISVKKLSNL